MRYNLLPTTAVSYKLSLIFTTLTIFAFLLSFTFDTFGQQAYTADEIQFRKRMEADGATLPVIDKAVEQRRLQEKIKHLPSNNQVPSSVLRTATASCADMGGETGWGDWTSDIGYNSSGTPYYGAASNPPTSPNFVLTSGIGIDQCGSNAGNPRISYVAPGFGNHSIRLGEPQMAGSVAERASFSFYVNATDTDFTYMYALVIQDAGHLPFEQPFISLCIHDASGASIPCGCFRYTGGPTMPGFFQTTCGLDTYYKPWTVVGVDLSAYVGQILTVEIENADCIYGGHYAYSYWDFTCGSLLNDAGYFCSGQTVDICLPPDASNQYTYLWNKNGLPYTGLPNATAPCIHPVPQVGDTFTVTIHPPTGCNFDLTYIPKAFEIYPTFFDYPRCGNAEFMDYSTTSTPTFPINSWQWSFPTGDPQTANTQYPGTINFAPGDHTITLIVSANNCYDTIQHTFTVNKLPEANFTSTSVCLGAPTMFSDQSFAPTADSIKYWTWEFPNGRPSVSIDQNPSVSFFSAGDQSATLIVQTMVGCIDTIQLNAHVHEIPQVTFDTAQTGCAPFSMNIQNTTAAIPDAINNWLWKFPGGEPSILRDRIPPTIVYKKPGVYSAYLYAQSAFGCSSETLRDSFVIVNSVPTADFATSKTEATGSHSDFEFKHLWSKDVTKWVWDFGDDITEDLIKDPSHNYSVAANENDFYEFVISLYVENLAGCHDTKTAKVRILPETAFFIPNTFTPNSDDANDYFFGKSYGVKKYQIGIYDRWGVLVWQCQEEGANVPYDKNSNEGMASSCKWDGKIDGKECAQNDVYVYKVHLVDVYDKESDYVGVVNLLH